MASMCHPYICKLRATLRQPQALLLTLTLTLTLTLPLTLTLTLTPPLTLPLPNPHPNPNPHQALFLLMQLCDGPNVYEVLEGRPEPSPSP